MAEQDRVTLKSYFETGDVPTEAQFINFIESVPNFLDEFATRYVKVSVSSPEIQNINVVPKTLVTAPGAGKILIPVMTIDSYTFNTAPYDTNTSLIIIHNGQIHQLMGLGGLINQAANIIRSIQPSTTVTVVENKALELTELTGNPATGLGTLIVYLWYKELTL